MFRSTDHVLIAVNSAAEALASGRCKNQLATSTAFGRPLLDVPPGVNSNQPFISSLFVSASVDDFVAVKAHDFNKVQQASISRPQQIQQQPLAINKIQQVSISFGIWFGTRGSEVQILSPRPFSIS